jgi:short-subunit dehydrogenase involved in D-alanine esterification of teichoic acids
LKLEPKKDPVHRRRLGIALELARRHAETNKVVIAGRDEAKLERAPRGGPELLVNNAASFAATH